MKMKKLLETMALIGAIGADSMASAQNLSLAYFMGPKHPFNAGVFTPFAEKLAEISGGG
jgi:TRAP-type transport system periplasmic protein